MKSNLVSICLCFVSLALVPKLSWSSISTHFLKHKKQVEKISLQENCKPKFFQANQAVKKKGVIVALHGFTACPQQYFQVARDHWTKAGFDVYTLLLPGHGETWSDERGLAPNIPNNWSWKKEYLALRNTAAQILNESQGEKIITGLSVGGAVALSVVSHYPSIVDRALITSPYLSISLEPSSEAAEDAWYLGPLFKDKTFWIGTTFTAGTIDTWGDGCKITEKNLGRAGSCSFKREAIGGIEHFGNYVHREAMINRFKILNKSAPIIHLIGVQKDRVADNKKTIEVLGAMKTRGMKTSACFYPAPANHSLLSTFDTPQEDKFWLPSVLENTTRFLSGEKYPSLDNTIEHGLPECD